MRHYFTLVTLLFCFFSSFQSPLTAQNEIGAVEIAPPEYEFSILRTNGSYRSLDCDGTQFLSTFNADVSNGVDPDIRIYQLRLTNIGGSSGFIRSITLSGGDDFTLQLPPGEGSLEGGLQSGFWGTDELTFRVVHDVSCPDRSVATLYTQYSGGTCTTSLREVGLSVSGGPAFAFTDASTSIDSDPNDGVLQLPDIFHGGGSIWAFRLVNIGDEPATITSVSNTGSSSFVITDGLPVTIAPGRNVNINVRTPGFGCGIMSGVFAFETNATFTGCGFDGESNLIPYETRSFRNCPGASVVLKTGSRTLECDESAVSFSSDSGPTEVDFTFTNDGIIPVLAAETPRVFEETPFNDAFFIVDDNSLPLPDFITRVRTYLPGENLDFTVALNDQCGGNCEGILRMTSNVEPGCGIGLRDGLDMFSGFSRSSERSGRDLVQITIEGSGTFVTDAKFTPEDIIELLTGRQEGRTDKAMKKAAFVTTPPTSSSAFKAYPTVTKGSFTLELPSPSEATTQARIIDQLGRVVHSFTIPTGSLRVESHFPNVSAGVYFLRVENQKKILRLIKQ